MIRYLQIENFKSLKKIALPVERLNLLFGINGAGKSSVIQSILLLRQSYLTGTRKGLHVLNINGELVSLGTTADILCQNADEEKIRFIACFDDDNKLDVTYSFTGNSIPTGNIEILDAEKAEVPFAEGEAIFGSGFSYLAADHIEPRTGYNAANWDSDGMNPLGSHGEYAVPFLALKGNEFIVPEGLRMEGAKTDRLFDQISAWMSVISPGIRVSARYLPLEQRAKLDISYSGNRIASAPFLPVNVGFGIPYVLPLVTMLLTAKEGDLILIENPESHLHPRGQVEIARLIAKAASNGVQIICESHSDHVINGIRASIKKEILDPEHVSVVYFDKNQEQETFTAEINVDKNGSLSSYPPGLLDEWGIQMALLL